MESSNASQTTRLATQLTELLQQPLAASLIGLVLVILITTRAITSIGTSIPNQNGESSPKSPPAHPYWFPFLGHIPSMAIPSFLTSLRDKYRRQGLFSLNFFAGTHTIVTDLSFASQILGASHHTAEVEWLQFKITKNGFGFKGPVEAYNQVASTPGDSPYKHIVSDPGLAEVTEEIVRCLKMNAPDLVTFNSYPVDQMDWERLANADMKEGEAEPVVEADLTALIQNFVAITSSSSIWGSNFAENLPDIWGAFWKFDKYFPLLVMGLPFWLPVPGLLAGYAARRKIANCLREYEIALDEWAATGQAKDARWQDLDNVSRMTKWRVNKFRNMGMDIEGRIAMDTALLWATTSTAKTAVSWMIVECYRDPVILARVREEILPYVQVDTMENQFGPGIWVAPTVTKWDVQGLMNNCPLLKSVYVEVLRVYTASWSIRWLGNDFLLRDKATRDGAYTLAKGTYAHVAQELHQFDGKYFDHPEEFRAERHIVESVREDGKVKKSAEMGTIKPYGGGPASCKGRVIAAREMMLYTAMIVSMWEIQMPPGDSWGNIKLTRTAGGKVPVKPLRVRIRRRKLPVTGATS